MKYTPASPFNFLTLEGGYAYLFSGPYVKDTSYAKGYSDRDADILYFQTVIKF